MRELFVVYLSNSLQLSIIILLLLAFSPLLERRYSAKCRYYLWAVIFAALIIPVRAKITLTLPEAFQSILPRSIDAAASGTAAIDFTVKAWDWYQYAGLLWTIGVFCFLSWHLFQHLRFLSGIRRWSEDIKNADLLEQFILIKAELGIREHITIKSCACIKTPMVIGLLHPVVLLPHVNYSQDELPLILKHELVHYKRKDLWYKVLMMIVLAIHWFNPVVHLMGKSVLSLCEISCDEEVLKEIDAKGRARYGESIIGIVRDGKVCQTALSTNFYSGIKGMKKRIYAMMDMTRKRFSPVLFIAVFMIAVCGTTTFALSPSQTGEIVQGSNKTEMTDTDTRQADSKPTSVQSSSFYIDQTNKDKPSSNDSVLLPNESEPTLIPANGYTSAEPSQEKSVTRGYVPFSN